MTANLNAPAIELRPVSVTRKMAASLPALRRIAEERGLQIHHLGAGYPHPEVTDPRGYVAHKQAWMAHLAAAEGNNDPDAVPDVLREAYNYTDTLGPAGPRESFARVYGQDWGVALDPARLIPTVGATGGMNLVCSVFERPAQPLAWITDAPTYAGFLARATLNAQSAIYSVEMDEEGPLPAHLRAQIDRARGDGRFVPLYYTVPDGHNPAGFSFSARRRAQILEVIREAGILILEDAPYLYINYAPAADRAQPFLAMDPQRTIHLFTASKIGLPGPRVGFAYTEAVLATDAGRQVALTDLLLTEASADTLFCNPEALRGFEALLHDERFEPRPSLWPVAEDKLSVYRENRAIMLDTLERELGPYPQHFSWTRPAAGFFTVFTFKDAHIRTDDDFVARLVSEYGIVAIPMYDFYPADARERDPDAGMRELRLSFCFSESIGAARRRDLQAAVDAFCRAARIEAGIGVD